jgi:two-component SAPR family response regulator/Flp pilus assembly protein TadD
MSHALVTLDTWLRELPPSILITNPGIISIRGVIEYMKGNLQEGLDLFNQAEVNVRNTNNITTLALTLVRRATLHRLLGDYKAALQDANEVLIITEANDQLQSINANALRQKGLSLFHQGQPRLAVKILEHALEFYIRVEDTSHIPILMMETGMAYNIIGKRNEAKRLYDEALKIWKRDGNLTWQASLLNNLGVLYHLDGEYYKAVLAFEEGLLCAKQSGFSAGAEALLLISLGDVYTEIEEFDLAQQYYQQGQNMAEEIGDRFSLIYLYLSQANLSLHQRKLDMAHRWLDDASSLISAQAFQYFEDGLYHLLLGQLFFQEKYLSQAVKALKIAEDRFKSGGTSVEYAKSQILLAAAYYQEKNQLEAKNKIKNILESQDVTEHSFLIFLQRVQDSFYGLQGNTEMGVELRELIQKSQRRYAKMPGIRRHVRRLARTIEIPDAKLTIRAFGRAHVKVGGKLLAVSDWQTQSVRDLFFYFLTMTEPLTKEQIGAVFWPDVEEPSRLKMRFKNGIYRLRRAVGSETILFENDLYYFNRSLDFEYDVDAFESLLSQAKMTKDPNLQIELFQRAVNLVNGHFLEDIDAAWVWPERERLDKKILKTLFELAELLKKANRIQDALIACERALEHDSSFEAAYFLAMNLHVQLNDRVGAIHLYETYTEMMDQELDLPPSPEMEALYKRLLL